MAKTVFKFLDAYTKEDKDRFFGREEDEAQLYEMSFNTRLMLIYGASGTGKTSLVQCGLSRRFGNTRWKEVYVRRGGDIM
ncbi:MAG: ATP-binding protein, partial [Saprospiraceae bacterium]